MKKPRFLNKFEFDDFSAEYYLKTYLGDRALIVNYNSNYNAVSVWLEDGTFIRMCHKIDLQASEEEIKKAYYLLCEKTGNAKSMTIGGVRVDYSLDLPREVESEHERQLQEAVDSGGPVEYHGVPIQWEIDEPPSQPEPEQPEHRSLPLSEVLRTWEECGINILTGDITDEHN